MLFTSSHSLFIFLGDFLLLLLRFLGVLFYFFNFFFPPGYAPAALRSGFRFRSERELSREGKIKNYFPKETFSPFPDFFFPRI